MNFFSNPPVNTGGQAFWNIKIDEFKSWKCPYCQKGHLSELRNPLKDIETEKSKSIWQTTEAEPDWYEGKFVILLKCSSNKREELVILAGESCRRFDQFYDEKRHTQECISPFYIPKSMVPPHKLSLFQKKCLKKLKIV